MEEARQGNSQIGKSIDLGFLDDDLWLKTSAVLYQIIAKKSRWWILILFVDSKNPFRFRYRTINHYPSLKLAENYAMNLQRGIRRDPQGTYKINSDAFDICAN